MTTAFTVNVVQGSQGTGQNVPLMTAGIRSTHYSGITRLPEGTRIVGTGWILAFDLGIDLEFTENSVIAASPWIDDYAQGANQSHAVQNLLISLAEYRESLERRAQRAVLSDELTDTLWKLQSLLVKR